MVSALGHTHNGLGGAATHLGWCISFLWKLRTVVSTDAVSDFKLHFSVGFYFPGPSLSFIAILETAGSVC